MASLPLGQWKANANGFQGTLTIDSVDGSGNVKATFNFGKPEKLFGLWDESGRKLTLVRDSSPGQMSAIQVYTGYLMAGKALAGSFEAFAGTGGTGVRNVFGWLANKT